MNETAVSVSRQIGPRQQRCLVVSARHRLIRCCALAGAAVVLAVTTGRDADWIPAPTPASVGCLPVVSPKTPPPSSPLSTVQVGSRVEPEYRGDDRAPVVLVSVPAHPAFSSPMWRFLLDGPVRPAIIDVKRNTTYYGVVVTIPFGG